MIWTIANRKVTKIQEPPLAPQGYSEVKNALSKSIPPQFCTSWQHEIAVAFFSHSDHYFKVNAKKTILRI